MNAAKSHDQEPPDQKDVRVQPDRGDSSPHLLRNSSENLCTKHTSLLRLLTCSQKYFKTLPYEYFNDYRLHHFRKRQLRVSHNCE